MNMKILLFLVMCLPAYSDDQEYPYIMTSTSMDDIVLDLDKIESALKSKDAPGKFLRIQTRDSINDKQAMGVSLIIYMDQDITLESISKTIKVKFDKGFKITKLNPQKKNR